MKRAALLLCLAGLLSACGSDDSSSPATLPPVTAPATVTSAPTSAAPTGAASAPVPKPAEADAFTSEGAAEFVRYYFAVLSSAIQSNDPKRLQALSAAECEGCQRYVTSILEARNAGQTVQTQGLIVDQAVAPAIREDETTVLVDFDAAPFRTFDRAGARLSDDPGKMNLTGELRCVRATGSPDTWRVMGFRLVNQ